MKDQFLKRSLILLTVAMVALTSCKKDKTEEPTSNDVQLLKISSWNPTTDAETASTEFTYDNSGKLKTVVSSRVNLAVNYATNGKVSNIKGLNSTGGEVSYSLEYNAAGQISKVIYVYMNPKDFGYTKTFEYNAAGKVIKTSSLSAGASAGSSPYIVEYTWNGDNIATSKITNGATVSTSTYVSYDTKLNPYSLGDGIAAIISGSPASKNNFTELSTNMGSTTSVQKRSYEYNTSGYAVSLKLLDGSNEGQKFYYNK